MPIIFEEHESRMGSKHLMSEEPFAVIRDSGEIYLSGDYTIEELRAILEVAEHSVHPTSACCRAEIIPGIRQGEPSLCSICGGTCG